MPTVLITGANRGLGLEFVRQYAADGWTVHACCRSPDAAKELKAIKGAIMIHALDVADRASVKALAKALKSTAIDVLINNAGVYGGERDRQTFGKVDDGSWDATLRANALGPLMITEALIDNVVRGGPKIIACVTSKMGSMADNRSGGAYIYRASKAALNAVVVSLALDLKARGVTVIAFHPGWVQTDMGGRGAPITPKVSVAGMRAVITAARPADSGKFLNYNAATIPW
ncbi:MAG: SDR family oxidoreductase [Alphaproteobacteria bacterium]|nr:SDR family oxidoreductase [Alphaproteobacteria bacterium]